MLSHSTPTQCLCLKGTRESVALFPASADGKESWVGGERLGPHSCENLYTQNVAHLSDKMLPSPSNFPEQAWKPPSDLYFHVWKMEIWKTEI